MKNFHFLILILLINSEFIKAQVANDLELLDASFHMGEEELPYYQIPIHQLSSMKFIGLVKNVGNNTQYNVKLRTLVSPTNHSQISPVIDSILPGGLVVIYDSLSSNAYTLPSTLGQYDIKYTIESDSNLANPNNDTIYEYPISVTNNIYARDNGISSGTFSSWANGTGPGSIGAIYEITKDTLISCLQIGISSTTDLANNPVLSLQIDKFDEVTNKFVTQVTKSHTISSANFGINQFGLTSLSQALQVQKGDIILVSVGSFDQQNAPIYIQMAQPTKQRSVLGYDNGLLTNLINPTTPIVRLDMLSCYTSNINELNNIPFEVYQNYPNPSANNTTIEYKLKKASNVKLAVHDISGKKIFIQDYGNTSVGRHSIDLNTKTWTAGLYFYTLNIDGIEITKKMQVIK